MRLFAYLSSPSLALFSSMLVAAKYPGSTDGGQKGVNDIQALNFALHIMHLTSALYTHMFNTFTNGDFVAQGNFYWVRRRYGQVNDLNEGHKTWLQSAITAAGGTPVDPCEYDFTFPTNRTSEFLKISEAVQQLATSGLAGLLRYVDDRDYIKALASMLAVKARHTSWTMSAVRSQGPWGTAFETPITLDHAYTGLATYISSCPASNLALLPPGLETYQPLQLQLNVTAGQPFQLQFDASALDPSAGSLLATFVYGTGRVVVPVHDSEDRALADDAKINHAVPLVPGIENGIPDDFQIGDQNEGSQEYWVKIPLDVQGQGGVYVFLTQGDGGDNAVAGPTLLSFPWDPVSNSEHGGVVALLGYNMFVL